MKPTEIPGLYKDESGAILNTNSTALEIYKKKKEQSRKINQLELRVLTLETELRLIKEIIKEQNG